MAPTPDDGWIEWKNHVLGEIRRLNKSVEKYRDMQQKMAVDLAELRRIDATLEKYRDNQRLMSVDIAKQKVYIGLISAVAAIATSAIATFVIQYFMQNGA
jgi:hypothetical protein